MQRLTYNLTNSSMSQFEKKKKRWGRIWQKNYKEKEVGNQSETQREILMTQAEVAFQAKTNTPTTTTTTTTQSYKRNTWIVKFAVYWRWDNG